MLENWEVKQVEEYIEVNCVTGPEEGVNATKLFDNYQRWADGAHPGKRLSLKRFGTAIGGLGYAKIKRGGLIVREGLDLGSGALAIPAGPGGAVEVAVELIDENPIWRRHIEESTFADLKASISEIGLQEPITVSPVPGSDRYYIVAGLRRFRAVEALSYPTIRAYLVDLPNPLDAVEKVTEMNKTALAPTPIDRAETALIYLYLRTHYGADYTALYNSIEAAKKGSGITPDAMIESLTTELKGLESRYVGGSWTSDDNERSDSIAVSLESFGLKVGWRSFLKHHIGGLISQPAIVRDIATAEGLNASQVREVGRLNKTHPDVVQEVYETGVIEIDPGYQVAISEASHREIAAYIERVRGTEVVKGGGAREPAKDEPDIRGQFISGVKEQVRANCQCGGSDAVINGVVGMATELGLFE